MIHLKTYYSSGLMLLIIFLSGSGYLWSQREIKEFYVRKNIRQDGLQCQFNVLDEDKHGVWFYQRHKRYHWFKSQQVISTEGASAGVLLHGTYEAFYGNKQLAMRGRFNKGLKASEWMFWYEDGSISRLEHWNNGRQLGEQISYAQNGEVKELVHLRLWSKRVYANDSLREIRGNKERILVYDERHQLVSDEHFKHGVLHGKVAHFEDGKRIELLNYRDGELIPTKERKERTAKEKTQEGEKLPFFQRIFKKKKDGSDQEKTVKEKKENPRKEDEKEKEHPEKARKTRAKKEAQPN